MQKQILSAANALMAFAAVAAIALVACLACKPPARPARTFDAAQKKLLADSFVMVWETVRDRHYDPDLGGLDWQEVRDRYEPKIEAAASNDEGREIMNEMLGLLEQTHISVIPASAYDDLQGMERGDHSPGIDLRVLGGRAFVTGVAPGSPAERAGVGPGWEILKVDGKSVETPIERVAESYSSSTLKDIMTVRVILGAIDGPETKAVEIEFHDGTDIRSLTLDRATPRGEKLTLGNMPSAYFWVETESLKSALDIRVIRFNVWLNPQAVADAFSEIMKGSDQADGFVIDLRGNPGGIGGMAMGAAGWFTPSKGQKLGVTIMRGTTLNFVISPRPRAATAPLAILVDGLSASTSEIFAGGMQDIKRARVFGSHTAGAALPSAFIRLPNGDGFQYIVANYISEGGKPLEGIGVTPDESVDPTQADLLAGRDPVMEAAAAWICRERYPHATDFSPGLGALPTEDRVDIF